MSYCLEVYQGGRRESLRCSFIEFKDMEVPGEKNPTGIRILAEGVAPSQLKKFCPGPDLIDIDAVLPFGRVRATGCIENTSFRHRSLILSVVPPYEIVKR